MNVWNDFWSIYWNRLVVARGGIGAPSTFAACCWMASASRSNRWLHVCRMETFRPCSSSSDRARGIGPPIWERLARRMTAELEPESAWAIDDTGFPKQGDHSVGVERQYSGTLGKTGNCQVAVSLHHVGAQGSAALNWRLYLPESWIGDQEPRAEAGIPKEVEFQKKWQLALEMIDEVRGWRLTDRIVLADAGYGDAAEFRDALEARKLSYAVGVSSQVGVWGKPPKIHIPEYSGRGQPATRYQYGKQRPTSVRDVALHAKGWKKIRWREGSKGWLESRFLAVRVQPSHGFVDGEPPHKEVWLLVQWPEEEKEPTRYFLCDLPPSTTL